MEFNKIRGKKIRKQKITDATDHNWSYIVQHRTESTFILHSGCEFRAVFTIFLPACTASWNGFFFFFSSSHHFFRAKEDLRRDFCSCLLGKQAL